MKCAFQPGFYATYNRNRAVWLRFARVLSEGSGTFARDGFGEDIGVSFAGVGNALATDIVYDALLQVSSTSSQLDIANLMLSAGSAYGKTTEVKYSLGAVGFSGLTSSLAWTTDETPRAVIYNDWALSNLKNVFVYKEPGASNIKVKYHNGSAWVTDTISAGIVGSPTAVVFNQRLHIFWRASGNAIKNYYYNSSGSKYGPHDLSVLGLSTGGNFDVTVFNGDLYVGFNRVGSNTLSIARCVETTYGCTADTSDWQPYGSYRYKTLAGADTRMGVGLAAGTSLNGAGTSEYLYALLSWPYSGADYQRLYLARVNTSDAVVDYRWMPNTYPSYTSDGYTVRSLTLRPSAFSTAGKYLYLSWNGVGSNNIYVSVLQNWNPTWFTRSIAIGDAEEMSYYGPTFWRHDTSEWTRFVYANTSGTGYYNAVWTKY